MHITGFMSGFSLSSTLHLFCRRLAAWDMCRRSNSESTFIRQSLCAASSISHVNLPLPLTIMRSAGRPTLRAGKWNLIRWSQKCRFIIKIKAAILKAKMAAIEPVKKMEPRPILFLGSYGLKQTLVQKL